MIRLRGAGRCGGGEGGNRGHQRFKREAKSSVISCCTTLSRATGLEEAMLACFTVAPRHMVAALHGGEGRRARCGSSSSPAYHYTHVVCTKRTTATACERLSTSPAGNPIGWVEGPVDEPATREHQFEPRSVGASGSSSADNRTKPLCGPGASGAGGGGTARCRTPQDPSQEAAVAGCPTYAVNPRIGDEAGSGEPPAHAPLDKELPQSQLERNLELA